MESPFKFLEAYGKQDRDLFFGREDEIQELYDLVRKCNLVIVYGKSGTGKTSLIKCGLASEFDENETTMIEVRRGTNINQSLAAELSKLLKPDDKAGEKTITQLIQKLYNRHLRPVFLLLDQFEELFISGDKVERDEFLKHLISIRESDVPCVIVLVIRQEYLADLTPFKKEVPFLFQHTLQVEQMDQDKSAKVVYNIFDKLTNPESVKLKAKIPEKICYDKEMTTGIIDIVSDGKFFVELPYLQVYLDKLFKVACEQANGEIKIYKDLLQDERLRDIETVINNLLDDQILAATKKIGEESDAKVISFLKIFVTDQDTKKPVSISTAYDNGKNRGLTKAQIDICLQIFTNALLLRPLENNQYELSHDSVAAKIGLKRARAKRLVSAIEGNPYIGLKAFTEKEEDIKRFFGRSDAVEKVLKLIDKQPLVVISGSSGTGKSSLVKAGILPELKRKGYNKLEIMRPGNYPLDPLNNNIEKIRSSEAATQYVLLIDQYEELITRSSHESDVELFTNTLLQLIENPSRIFGKEVSITIIITIRSDFEPQFKSGGLEKYWDNGRYVLPYMSNRELEQVIEYPAELAACYFEPVELIKNIAEEVSGRPSALPLLSFALSLMYNASLPSRIITRKIYNNIGVFGALQTKADEIYGSFGEPAKNTMRNLLLRMISLEGSEVASRKVYTKTELVFDNKEENERIETVVHALDTERLISRQIDENQHEYVEPAHDALLKGWNQLWDWIKEFGKENILLRERLGAAIGEWEKHDMTEDALWTDESRLYDLKRMLESKNKWLNKKETDFAKASLRKKQEADVLIEKAMNEKLLLVKDKLEAEKERNKEKDKALKKERSYRRLLVGVCLIAFVAFIIAWNKANLASRNLITANSNQAKANSANRKLASANNSLISSKRNLQVAYDSMEVLIVSEKVAKQKAIEAAKTESQQRLIAERASKRLIQESMRVRKAEELAISRGDSLRLKVDILDMERKRIQNLNDSLITTTDSLGKIFSALNKQKTQNTSQLASISKTLQSTDIVKSYQVARFAYQLDSLHNDTAITRQFTSLQGLSSYYYTRSFNGSFSYYSPDGKYVLLVSPTDSVIIKNTANYTNENILIIPGGFISAAFTSSQRVMIVNKNKILLYAVKGKSEALAINRNNISQAAISKDESKILIVTDNKLIVYDIDIPNKEQSSLSEWNVEEKNKIISAYFSDDNQRIIAAYTDGSIRILDITTKEEIFPGKSKSVKKEKVGVSLLTSYLSPIGNYFLQSRSSGVNLFDSEGKDYLTKKLNSYIKKPENLYSCTFSSDGEKLLISLYNVSTRLSQQQQQQQQQRIEKDSKNKNSDDITLFIVNLVTGEINEVTDLIEPADRYAFLGSYNVAIDDNFVFFGGNEYSVKVLNLDNNSIHMMTGLSGRVNTISILNGQVLTSDKGNSTKIWQYGTGRQLERSLPVFSEDDKAKYLGIK